MENINHHAGSATGIDLSALEQLAQAPMRATTAIKAEQALKDFHDAANPATVLALIALARATPQHPDQKPVAYLHQVVAGDGEPDEALSFAPDNFPLAGTLGYRSVGYRPLYDHPATPQHPQTRALREVSRQQVDQKLATTGATAYERFLWAELTRLQAAVIADAATPQHSVTEQDERKPCRQCDPSVGYVCEEHGGSDDAEIYLHACELMEMGWKERAKRGVKIGAEGSLCDGIMWIFDHMQRLETRAAQPLPSTAATQPEQASALTLPGCLADRLYEAIGIARDRASRAGSLTRMAKWDATNADLRAALAIPASTAPTQHDPMMSVLTESRVIELFDHEFGAQDFAIADSEVMAFALSIEDEVLKHLQPRRFRAQGGNTNTDSIPASTAASEQQAGWVDKFGNVWPLGAYSLNGKPSYHDAHKRDWQPLYRRTMAVTDAQIIAALHAQGIDTYPSKYGFDAMQVSATSVPSLRKVIEALSGRATIASEADERALFEIFAAIDEAQRMNHYNESSFEIGKRVARLKCLADDFRVALTHRATTAADCHPSCDHIGAECDYPACKTVAVADQQGDTASASGAPIFGLQVWSKEPAMVAGWLAQQGAAQAQAGGMAREDAIGAVINHIADNWPMKKYTLEEIEIRLRAELAAMAAPVTSNGSK